MGFKEISIGIVLVALFSLSMITFVAQTQITNNATSIILNDPALSGFNESLNTYLGNIEDTAQTQREVFEQQEAQGDTADQGFSLTSIVGIVQTFFSTAVQSFNLIFSVLSDVLGIPAIVFNVILGAIIIVVLLLIWRIIKIGGT